MAFWTRGIRPTDPELPNTNPPGVPPASVGPPDAVPGDPSGVVIVGDDPGWAPPPRITASPWSGWPADWATPIWSSQGLQLLTDTAFMCVDRNASVLAAMPPYLVDAASTLSADWLNNPDPDQYTSWDEFIKSVFWDYQAAGEAFILATSYYSTGWPARFHVVKPWFVEIDLVNGLRVYRIGGEDVTDDMLHIRYQSSVGYAHGTGPLEAGQMRIIADQVLTQYGTKLATTGVPTGVLTHPGNISAEQAALLQQQWVASRSSSIGEPAVLGGGITWAPTQLNPSDMALLDLLRFNQARIAELLGIPPILVGLPTGGDPMTYRNVAMLYSQHWRSGLQPKAKYVMAALSGWLLPRGTTVELNSDAYVAGDVFERAQAYQILAGIVDPVTGAQALTVAEIREAERLGRSTPGVLAG
jgi:HK97 family phage portal protein